jgi:putative ABC transport system permease protein
VTSLAAIGMLGLGVGITTAMFTIVDALLLRPVPFRDADRLRPIRSRCCGKSKRQRLANVRRRVDKT